MTTDTMKAVSEALGYEFKDEDLLRRALTHSSRRNETGLSYERLEFLGDAVLGLVIAEHLYRKCPDRDEGELTRMKSSVVSGRTLARAAREAGLEPHVDVDKGIAAQQKLPASVLSDALEALIGAVYVEAGFRKSKKVILTLLAEPVADALQRKIEPDYKSNLQEWAHVNMRATPTYKLLASKGPEHTKRFQTAVIIAARQYGVGWGDSKRAAEQQAAAETLRLLGVED